MQAVQGSGRGFYNGGGQQSYYPSPDDRYQADDPAADSDYNLRGYQNMSGQDTYTAYQDPSTPYNSRVPDGRGSEYECEKRRSGWDSRSYGSRQQEGWWGSRDQGSPSQDPDSLDIYSRGETAFLPTDGEPEPEIPERRNSRILDEVESFYNRPESVVEDVEKYYDGRSQGSEPFQEVRICFVSARSIAPEPEI